MLLACSVVYSICPSLLLGRYFIYGYWLLLWNSSLNRRIFFLRKCNREEQIWLHIRSVSFFWVFINRRLMYILHQFPVLCKCHNLNNLIFSFLHAVSTEDLWERISIELWTLGYKVYCGYTSKSDRMCLFKIRVYIWKKRIGLIGS